MRAAVRRATAIVLAATLCAACAPLWADAGPRGRALYEAGRYDAAEPHLRRSLAAAERRAADGAGRRPALADALYALGQLRWAQGRYDEAEPLLERTAAIRERALGRDHPAYAEALNRWATVHLDRGQPARAEPLLERARAVLEGAGGPAEAALAFVLDNLGLLRERQGRPEEAEASHLRAIGIRERRLGPDHPDLATSLASLGALYLGLSRYAEAEPLLRRSLAVRERALPPGHPRTAASLASLGVLEAGRGRRDEAERLLRRSLAIRERAFGRRSAQTAAGHVLLANLHLRQGRPADALEELGHVAASRHGTGPDPHLAGGSGDEQARAHGAGVRAGWALAAADPARRAALVDDTLRAAQRVHASDVGAAVAGVAARFAARDDALARLVRERQDLAGRWRELDLTLLEAAGAPAAGSSRASLESLDRDLTETGARLAALDRELARRFPDYQALAGPEPAGVAEVQGLLGPDEALLAFLALPADPGWLEDAGVFLWVVAPGGASLHRLDLDPAGLEAAVRRLREGLDPDRWADGADPPPFDAAAAHELHERLLPPGAAGLLAGARHLLVVPDGPLESLPLSVLVRAPPPPDAAHGRVDWLARTHATTTLPSVAALGALRRLARTSKAPEPFRGVGDPAFEAPAGADPPPPELADAPPGSPRRGLVAPSLLRALPPLPESAEELRTLAARLGAGESSLLLREAATERAVKAGALRGARVVAFATHAGVAGQLPGLAEPALVLTPPAVPSEEDDGLLTAGEAAHLELDADLVLLSACNTAAPDGTPGAPGLSGLASAFIYAGSRALLVSHWSVISDAAERLTTGMLAELARDPELGRAEALRRSMVAVMDDASRRDLAHPAAWAPFVIVGQGGAPARFR